MITEVLLSIIPIAAKPLNWYVSVVSLPGTVFQQIQSVYSFTFWPNTADCCSCFWGSRLIDIRFSEWVFSLLTDPNSFEISSLTYVWTSLVKIFVILPSFGIDLGPCKSDLYRFHFLMLSMNPKLLVAVTKIWTVSVSAFVKNLNFPWSYTQTSCQNGKV